MHPPYSMGSWLVVVRQKYPAHPPSSCLLRGRPGAQNPQGSTHPDGCPESLVVTDACHQGARRAHVHPTEACTQVQVKKHRNGFWGASWLPSRRWGPAGPAGLLRTFRSPHPSPHPLAPPPRGREGVDKTQQTLRPGVGGQPTRPLGARRGPRGAPPRAIHPRARGWML